MSEKILQAVTLATICLCPLTAGAQDGDFDLDSPAPMQSPAAKPVLVNEASIGLGSPDRGVQTGGEGRYGRADIRSV
jgi:hypothetical protein